MEKLYKLEMEYQEALKYAIYTIEEGCTLGEFLDLGFNNATLFNPLEEDTDSKDIKNLYDGSDMLDKLSEEQLNVNVSLSSTYEDFDGMTCANIVLDNEKDWKLFEPLLEEELEV